MNITKLLHPILIKTKQVNKSKKQVSWGYKHFLKASDPQFNVKRVTVDQPKKRRKRGSLFVYKRNYLRFMKDSLKEGFKTASENNTDMPLEPTPDSQLL